MTTNDWNLGNSIKIKQTLLFQGCKNFTLPDDLDPEDYLAFTLSTTLYHTQSQTNILTYLSASNSVLNRKNTLLKSDTKFKDFLTDCLYDTQDFTLDS